MYNILSVSAYPIAVRLAVKLGYPRNTELRNTESRNTELRITNYGIPNYMIRLVKLPEYSDNEIIKNPTLIATMALQKQPKNTQLSKHLHSSCPSIKVKSNTRHHYPRKSRDCQRDTSLVFIRTCCHKCLY